MFLRQNVPWTQQPTMGAAPAWGTALCRDMDVLHASPWDLNVATPGANLIKVGSPQLRMQQGGNKGAFCGNNYANRFTCDWPSLADGQQYTYAYCVTMYEISTTDLAICGDNVDSATRAFQMQIVSGVPNLIVFNTAVSTFVGSGGTLVIGKPTWVLGRAGAKAEIWVDGKLGATSATITGTIKGTSRTPVNVVELGCRSFSMASSLNGALHTIVRWRRALSDAEVKQFFDNPYQVFAP